MTKVQFIKIAGGVELAILPKSEYDRLAKQTADEDVGTARLVQKARDAIATGREIVLPKAVVDRLAAGEDPIRVLREWRGTTQVELVATIGITQGYLSELEAGKRKGPVALHQKIARALGVPIEILLPTAVSDPAADSPRVARRRTAVREIQQARRRR
jgi:DNA-binding XRE family transcriptional regulator